MRSIKAVVLVTILGMNEISFAQDTSAHVNELKANLSKVDTTNSSKPLNERVASENSNQTDYQKSLIVALVTGLFALVGSYGGVLLNRKSQHQTWLLERRAEVFSDFLRVLDTSERESSAYLRKERHDPGDAALGVYDFFAPAFSHAMIVRLFLKDDAKLKVEKLTREVFSIYATWQDRPPNERPSKEINVKKQEIQAILEANLKSPKW